MEEPDEKEIARLRKELATFCSLHNYRLVTVFVDRGVPDRVFARTEFTRLLHTARETGAYGVAVPTLDHLSADIFVQGALVRMVTLTGAALFVVDESKRPDAPPDDAQEQSPSATLIVAAHQQLSVGPAVPAPDEDNVPSSQIGDADHALIEQTRNMNKTLSLFVFALQEGAEISVESHRETADMLDALASAVRARRGRPKHSGHLEQLR